MEQIFVDRIDITDDLIKKIENRENSLVVILHSKTGVGKTTLVRHIFKMLRNKYKKNIFVSVSTNPVNESTQAINDSYAIEIFEKISKLMMSKEFGKRELSFSRFASSCKNKRAKKHLLEFIDERFIKSDLINANILYDSIDIIFQKIFKIGIFDEENILDEIEKNMLVVNDYIKYVFSKAVVFIHIENIQNIDWTSEKYLQEWIQESKKQENVFFLEYTEAINENKLSKFIDSLETTEADVYSIGLRQLKSEDVVEIAIERFNYKEASESSINDIAAHYETASDGNIFEIENYILTYDRQKSADELNSVTQKLILLEKNEKFIIAILIIHEGKIASDSLVEILRKSHEFYINTEYTNFVERMDLIIKQEDAYYLKHSSIIDAWKNSPALMKDTTYFLAFKECRDYYLEIYNSERYFSISKVDTISILLNMYSEFDPSGLPGFLDDINILSITTLSKERVWRLLNLIFEGIKCNSVYEKIIYHMIQICLQCELFEEAGYMVKTISDYSNFDREKYILYYCLVQSLREMPNEVYKTTQDNIGKIGREADQYLYLFQISALRSMNKICELSELIRFLKKEDVFTNAYTKGYFLRLSEVYESRQNAEECIKESISVFEAINENEQAAKSRISLSYILATQGKYKEAAKQNNLAENILISSNRNRCIFCVNKAVLQLLSKQIDDTIWDLLETAELLTQLHFNRCAIYINKIIYCIETNDYEKGGYCANILIKELQNVQDLHLIAIASYDLYYFFDTVNDNEKATKYYDIAYKFREHCNTLNARLTTIHPNDGVAPLLKHPWHVCFLSYWDVDLKFG